MSLKYHTVLEEGIREGSIRVGTGVGGRKNRRGNTLIRRGLKKRDGRIVSGSEEVQFWKTLLRQENLEKKEE